MHLNKNKTDDKSNHKRSVGSASDSYSTTWSRAITRAITRAIAIGAVRSEILGNEYWTWAKLISM